MPWGPEDWDAWIEEGRPLLSDPGAPVRALEGILLRLPETRMKTVADLGCGSGALLPFLANHFEHVFAIDYAPARLATARRNSRGMGITFRRRDLRDLKPFRNTFQVAIAVDSILGPRTSDVDRMLEQIHRSLVESGLLLAVLPAAPRRGAPRPFRLSHEPGPPEPLLFHELELQYRLRRAGFRGIRIRRFRENGAPDKLLCVATRCANN